MIKIHSVSEWKKGKKAGHVQVSYTKDGVHITAHITKEELEKLKTKGQQSEKNTGR